jgi:C-terminal processing protease CtpA/Prc
MLAFVEDKNNYAYLWLKVERKNQEIGFFDIMDDRPITSDEWKEYEIAGEVVDDAQQISIGCSLHGEGFAVIDYLLLEANDGEGWKTIGLENPDFEKDTLGTEPKGWKHTEADYDFKVVSYFSESAKNTCVIESTYEKELFEKFPLPGEYFVKNISTGLSCAVPLCLYSDDNGTIPHCDKSSFNNLIDELEKIDINVLDADNVYLRLADIAIVWNIIQHSYPYFDLYNIDWESALPEYLLYAYIIKDKSEFSNVMNQMIALINDGHGEVYNPDDESNEYYPPFITDFAEGELVISNLYEVNTGFLEGDIIVEINGSKTKDLITEVDNYISSATPQWRRGIQKRLILSKKKNTALKLKIIRGDEIFETSVKCNYSLEMRKEIGKYAEHRPEKITLLKNDIYYIDLTRIFIKEVKDIIDKLAEAKGIVFDLRGYPKSINEILCHLTDIPLTSVKWNIPQIIYPDRENLVGYDTSGIWNLEPLKPKLNGKIVFITNGRAISYAESVMGIVEAFKLGTIVGEPTAGTNGNVNPITLPGEYNIRFTGMKVLKHDGTPHHGVGIKPTVPVNRTIQGIREKRDEFLEKALEIIEGK